MSRNHCALFLLLSVLGCAGDDGGGGPSGAVGSGGSLGDAAGGTGGAAGSNAGAAGIGGNTPECPGPGYGTELQARRVTSLTGRVADLEGNPVSLQATVCGLNLCIYGETDTAGTVVTCNDQAFCTPGIQPPAGQDLYRPAFKYGQGIDFAEFAYLLPPGQTDYDVDTMATVRFPPTDTASALEAGTTVTSGEVTLVLAATTHVTIEIFVFETEPLRRFRAASIPADRAPPAVDASFGFELVYATTPVNTTLCPPAAMSVPNSAGWPAGAEVEFFVHGLDTAEPWAPYAGWAKVSDGSVSSDGTVVNTAPDGGIPYLSVIGIRQRP
jgi:hypothetical protein